MEYRGYKYMFVVGVFAYGNFSGRIAGAEYHTLENAIDKMESLKSEGFDKDFERYERLGVDLQITKELP